MAAGEGSGQPYLPFIHHQVFTSGDIDILELSPERLDGVSRRAAGACSPAAG
jgi:hypothetical protein